MFSLSYPNVSVIPCFFSLHFQSLLLSLSFSQLLFFTGLHCCFSSLRWQNCLQFQRKSLVLAGVCKCCLLPFPSSPTLPAEVPLLSPGVFWGNSQGDPGEHEVFLLCCGGHTEVILGSSLEVKRCLYISALIQNKDSPLCDLERSCKRVVIKASEGSAKCGGQCCGSAAVGVSALPCPSMGISPSSHVFSLTVLHFYHLLLSIFPFSLFLITSSVLLIFLTSIFS